MPLSAIRRIKAVAEPDEIKMINLIDIFEQFRVARQLLLIIVTVLESLMQILLSLEFGLNFGH